jgi:ABC-type dipeptide/oligopeptide/nickel transport system permease subunit
MSIEAVASEAVGAPLGHEDAAIRPRRRLSRGTWIVGAVLLGIIVLGAILAPVLVSVSPLQTSSTVLKGPSGAHWFGTDELGRDLFARVLYGSRETLAVGAAVTVLSTVLGALGGLVAGYFGGWSDTVLSRLSDVLLSVPTMLLAIVIVASLGSESTYLTLALVLVFVPVMLRVVRASTIAVRGRNFVRSAEAIGASPARVLFREIPPHVVGPALVQGTFTFAYAVLTEAALNFIGIGVRPPDPSWGSTISAGQAFLYQAPFYSLIPGLLLALTVFAANLLADGLEARRSSR